MRSEAAKESSAKSQEGMVLVISFEAAWKARPVHAAIEYSQRLSKFGHVENIPNLNGLSVDAPPDRER